MGEVNYHDHPAAVRPGGAAQPVAVLPELDVVFNVASSPDIDKIKKLLASVGAVELTVTMKAGAQELSKDEEKDAAPDTIQGYRVTDPKTTEVTVKVVVRGRVSSTHGAGSPPVMLTGEQVFVFTNGKLDVGPDRSPLFTVTSAGLVVRAEVQIDVLDYTHYWFDAMSDDTGKWLEKDRIEELSQDGGAQMPARCLLHVRASPALWYASIPEAVRTSSRSALSAFLFFQPYYAKYGDLDPSKNARWNSLFHFLRYVLAPLPTSDDGSGRLDYFFWDGSAHYVWIRAGMERSVRKSKKDVTLFFSLPDNTAQNHTAHDKMPEMIERALRLLASLGYVSQRRSKSAPLSLAKLAIGGYSESGEYVGMALQANVKTGPAGVSSPVNEVYIFDSRKVVQEIPPKSKNFVDVTFDLAKWGAWLKLPGVRLRVVRYASSPMDPLVHLAKTNGLDQSDPYAPTPVPARLTVWVTDPNTWDKELDANAWWKYVMKDTKPYGGPNQMGESKYTYGHQFMIVGGRGDSAQAQAQGETFLWEFLRDSDL